MPPPTNRTNRDKTSGRPSTTTPMSERQQMALLMQMTSSNESGKFRFVLNISVVNNRIELPFRIKFRQSFSKDKREIK